MNIFEDYLKSIKTFRISEITESTYRNKLQDLLEIIAKEINPKINIIHEPKREGRFGSPDYKVTITDNIIGYVENKPIGEDLDKVLASEQIEKYKSLSENLIVTNYIEFIWLKNGRVTKRENLSYLTDFESKKEKLDSSREKAIEELIKNFFSQAPKGISNLQKLAESLAIRARMLKDFLLEELKRQEKMHSEGKLYGLYQTFKKFIFNELSIEEFSDTFAQNLAYSLFLSKLNANYQNVNLYNAKKFIPSSFKLIKELVTFLDELDKEEYKNTRWIIEEILTVVNNLDLKLIIKNLTFKQESKKTISDPFIYFYEDFLSVYDKKLKKSKGVFYTPPSVVHYIIKFSDIFLKEKFGIKTGFADHNTVTVLDFATGTGTFLLEVSKQIIRKLPKNSGKTNLIIKNHILKNLYGFEYLIAPYTIAHMKLSQFLKEEGYNMCSSERFQIFLTNTLEPIERQLSIPLLPELSQETKDAQKVKDEPILVITGNPPYSIKSKNNGTWIMKLIEDYKPKGEKKININDDYIKFIRFAHKKMESVQKGIIAIITNNSFLNGITHRKMRSALINDFSEIYIINLHGNIRNNERTPSGEIDENVFDIKQGVSINIFIKNKNNKQNKCRVFYKDLWGKREEKNEELLDESHMFKNLDELNINKFNEEFKKTTWGKKRFNEDLNFFIPIKFSKIVNLYGNFIGLNEIFKTFGSCVKTDRDELVIDYTKENLKEKMQTAFTGNYNGEFKNRYKIQNSSSYYFKDRLQAQIYDGKNIYEYNYRPFDKRKIYYKIGFTSRPAYKIMKNLINNLNIGLTFTRNWESNDWTGVFISNYITDIHFIGGQTYMATLYLYSKEENLFKEENFKNEFRDHINSIYGKIYAPEEILSYIYCILMSSIYKEKYREFLKIDYPRIPLIKSEEIFKKLSVIGGKMIDAHILADVPEYNIGSFMGKGNNKVTKIKLRDKKLYINEQQYFYLVLKDINEFNVGGYLVLDRYLRDRKGKQLTLEEIENIESIIKVIAFTIDQKKKIDNLIKDWI